jgi:opacity protein-like surface antigen
MKMRYAFLSFVLSVVLVSSVSFAEENTEGTSFQILGQFGIGYAHNPDMSDWTKWLGGELADDLNAVVGSNSFKSDDSSANVVLGAEFEPRLFLGAVGLGASGGFYTTRAESKVESKSWADSATYTLTLNVIPVTGTLYYRKAVSDSGYLVFGAGAGYYMATLEVEIEDKVSIPPDFGDSRTFKNTAIGYHAKIEYNHVLSGSAIIYGGLMGRYVEFDKFEKNGVWPVNEDGSALTAGLSGVSLYVGLGLAL